MSTRSVLLAALVLALASTACQPPAQEAAGLSEEDVAALEAVMQEYARSALAGDIDAWAGLWVQDAVEMNPNAPAIVGREAIREKMADNMSALSLADFSVVVDDVDGRGDLAYVRGMYSVTMTAPEMPEAIREDGKYLTILRKQSDGNWRIAIDCYNSNQPLPEQSAESEM